MAPLLASLILLALAHPLLAQSPTVSSSIYSESGVPTGAPVSGVYDGALRPQIHYSPPAGFMNDPNGMFLDDNGTYHLYYQYNPTDIVAGNQHWGHATSEDLYHWTNQQIAIYPGAMGEGIFSGSAVIDVNNTSGFFPNQTNGVVAMYTLNTMQSQTQQIAYSYDGGYTFTKYAQNPVIPSNSTQFRDPKVLWYAPTKSWVAVISYAQEFAIGIFTSPDLKNWTHTSNFTRRGFLGQQYECPNLIAVPTLKNASLAEPFEASNIDTSAQMYILQISINPGAPQGGSISEYFPGTFNGTHFVAVDDATRLTDFGKDNYAGQFFYNIPSEEPQISIAWASNWEYSQIVPTGELEGFRSAMALPRWNVLANTTRATYTLLSYPYDLNPLKTSSTPLAQSSNLTNTSLYYDFSSNPSSQALVFSMNITGIPLANATGTANFTFLSSYSGEYIRGGFYLGGDTPVFIDRGHTGSFSEYNPFFTNKFSTTSLTDLDTQTFRLLVVIDRSIFEVFLNNGAQAATSTYFPDAAMDLLILASSNISPGVAITASVYGLDSTWAGQENTNGTVVGNSTMAGQRLRRDGMANMVGYVGS